MATGLQVWSQTAATNATADSAVNWAEGQAPSSVNDSARAEMAAMAKWRDDNNGTLVTTGSSAAFTVTSNQGSTANTDGYTLVVKFHATSDGTATLARDTAPAASLQAIAGTNLSGGEFLANTIHKFKYESASTAWVSQGANLLGPASVNTANLAGAAVTGAKIADATINSTNLVDSTIATTKIANNAITLGKLATYGANATGTIAVNLTTSAASPTTFALGDNLGSVNSKFDTKYGPKAWVTFTLSGTTVTVQKSFNVASVVRNATGNYTITFTNNMTDQYYVPCMSVQTGGSDTHAEIQIDHTTSPTVSALVVQVFQDANNVSIEAKQASIAIFGN